MMDLRYLGLTLMGIFLALAIGLMIGSALGSPDRRDAAYEGLRGQFELLRVENQRVNDENDSVRRRLRAQEQAIRELLPMAVLNRLPGSTVGVVICGPLDERRFWSELESALRSAGAEIGPVVRVPDRLRSLPDEDRSRLGPIWAGDQLSTEPEPFEVAGWMVRALARGGMSRRLEELAGATGISLRGELGGSVRRLLVLTSIPDEERLERMKAGEVPDLRVVDSALAEGLRVVVAEPAEIGGAGAGALEFLAGRNVPSVDNIDTSSGQLSVVLALAGAEGRFGSRPGATRPIPPLDRP